jgi:ribose transport system permease protein
MIDDVAHEPLPKRTRLFAGASAQLGLLAIVAGFWVVFSSLAPGFLSPFNLFSVSRTLAVDIVIGFAQMVVLATGGMNLAVGAIGVCCVMATGFLIEDVGLPVPIAMSGALALGAVLGWLNGFAIVRTGVNSFVITLASASLYLGAMLILTKAVPYSHLPPEVGAFGRLKIGTFLSPLLLVSLAIGIALAVLYRFSVLGRQILAAGANPRAAAMSGVPVNRVIAFSHTLSGLLAGAAALLVVLRLGAAVPSVGGDEWLLPSFLGPVLGGTLLSGGTVAVAGTMIGAALVTTIRSGLLVLQIGNFWLQLFLGVILLLAVMLDRYRGVYAERRRMGRQ